MPLLLIALMQEQTINIHGRRNLRSQCVFLDGSWVFSAAE